MKRAFCIGREMPWTVDDPPSVAKNWTRTQKRKCVDAANAALEDGKSEEDAIFACINAAGKSKKKKGSANMAATEEQIAAQQRRSRRYGIVIREDGNITKPAEWEGVSDSQFGDPVNYLYPVPDKQHAISAKSYFAQHSDKYDDERSRKRVKARINRLCRKYKVDPIQNSGEADAAELRHYMVGTIELGAPDDKEHAGLLKIPAVRASVLDHPWWGTLYFDRDLFESFIDNWETNVIGYDLAVDPDHDPHQGALAWVKDIVTDGERLDLWVAPTSAGEGVFGDIWRYASIEYTENFIDPETGVSYGPTLLGCGATNRPFVHRQDAIQVLSQDVLTQGEVPQGTSIVLLTNPKTEVEAMQVMYDSEEGIVQGGVDTGETPSADVALNAPVTPVEPPADSEPVDEQPAEQQAPAATPQPPAVQVQSLGQSGEPQVVRFSDGTSLTADQVAELMRSNAQLHQRDHERTVEEVTSTALARGVAPVVADVARQILSATNPLAKPTITLSVPGKEEEPVNKDVNLFNAVVEMLSLVPGRITEEPLSYSHSTETPRGGITAGANGNPYADVAPLTPEEAEEAAKLRRKELKIQHTRMAGSNVSL